MARLNVAEVTSRSSLAGAALVLGAASLWATFGLFAKLLYEAGYEALELASVRAAIGFAGVALVAAARRLSGRSSGVAIPRRALPFFAAYGILGFALYELIFFAALEHTTVSIGVALLYTAPAFVVLLSALLWRERIAGARALALPLVLVGVVLVTGAAGTVLRGDALPTPRALLLGIGAGFGYALYTLFSKVGTERHGAFASLFWSFGFAALALAFFANPLLPLHDARGQLPLLIALGIVPTILPYGLYLMALRGLRASTAAMLASLEPAVATLLAFTILGERLGALQLAGMALVVFAAVMLARTAGATDG